MLTSADIATELGCSLRHACDLMAEMSPVDISRQGSARPLWRVSREDFESWKERRKSDGERGTDSGSGARSGGAGSVANESRRIARTAVRHVSRALVSSELPPTRQTQPLKRRRCAT